MKPLQFLLVLLVGAASFANTGAEPLRFFVVKWISQGAP